MRAKKSLGQHFLISQSIVRDIVTAGSVERGEAVLEVGPGKGILTKELLARGASVTAIEKDAWLAEHLRRHFGEEIRTGQLSVIEDDIRDTDFSELPLRSHHYKVVANIPYYITGELIRLFVTHEKQPTSITFLVQKEIAERIAGLPALSADRPAGKRSRQKGSVLSMSVRAYGSPNYIKTVPKKFFKPVPKVDSAILVISDISKKRFTTLKESHFFKVLKTGFAKKRKKLLTNLSEIYARERVEQTFSALGLKESARAEELTIDQWIILAKSL